MLAAHVTIIEYSDVAVYCVQNRWTNNQELMNIVFSICALKREMLNILNLLYEKFVIQTELEESRETVGKILHRFRELTSIITITSREEKTNTTMCRKIKNQMIL